MPCVNNTAVRVAITRAVSPRIGQCELSYIERQPIDIVRAMAQHELYERLLAAHGCTIVHVADTPGMPDGVFVEDTAIVMDDIAIITRPGAASRLGETESIAEVLQSYRPVLRITEPATLDGGDLLVVNQTLYVGLSQRTNVLGVRQLTAALKAPSSRRTPKIIPVQFQNCLHLKSAVTQIGPETLLVNPEWVDPNQFPGFDCINVHKTEPFAANALRLDDTLLYSASYPRTRRILEVRGFRVERLDVSELEKAEAGVTCCSLVFSV